MNTYRYTLIFTILLVAIIPSVISAQIQCGDIIDKFGNRTPIVDCANPFNESSNVVSTAVVSIENNVVNEGDTVPVPVGGTTNYSITGQPRFDIWLHRIYQVVGSEYVEISLDFDAFDLPEETFRLYAIEFLGNNYDIEPLVTAFNTQSFDDLTDSQDQDFFNLIDWIDTNKSNPLLTEGSYVIVTNDFRLILSQTTWRDKLLAMLIPTVHAQSPTSYTYTLSFDISETATEPEIDPLLLQYAPVLYMHPDEDYFPMDVETFVEDSALWSQSGQSDTQIYDGDELTFAVFESVVGTNDTKGYYLAYSDPDTARSIDLATARTKYGQPNADNVTVYVHKMNDGFTDDFGVDHDYIVLQYWFFYAMNNWEEKVGGLLTNNHEGDWESVFIFLNADTEEPEYIAYSAHVNDSDPSDNTFQYDSVRRDWYSPEITFDNTRLVSFVALGSHANYPDSGNNGEQRIPLQESDLTSLIGGHISTENISLLLQGGFTDFEGAWGTLVGRKGFNGPEGPNFLDLTGQVRFDKPIEWAGIDKIAKYNSTVTEKIFQFIDSAVKMVFTDFVPVGTSFLVSPHFEFIDFGNIPTHATLLPQFWDIESSLTGSFSAKVSFDYDPAMVTNAGGNENNLAVFFYNPQIDVWEPQSSVVDTTSHTVSFTATHFSRYTLGFTAEETDLTPKELFELFRETVEETDLKNNKQRFLINYSQVLEKIMTKDGRLASKASKALLKNLERTINRYKRNDLTEYEREELLGILEEIKNL